MMDKLLRVGAWLIPIAVGIGMLYITFRMINFDVGTWSDYLNVALSAKINNLLLFYSSLIIFDFAFPPAGLTIPKILDSDDGWKFYCVLAVSTAYILGLT